MRALLAGNDRDAVLEIVGKLVAENTGLARADRRFKTSEKLNMSQLVMFLDALARLGRHAAAFASGGARALARIDNPIACRRPSVPSERACIGHDVTPVIELIPAGMIVRLDRREKLRCDLCEGQLARALVVSRHYVAIKMLSPGAIHRRLAVVAAPRAAHRSCSSLAAHASQMLWVTAASV